MSLRFNLTRRQFIKNLGMTGAGLAAGMALSGCSTAATTRSVPPRPNILFIFTDDHAVQSISAYGSRINRTPNLDRIAHEGVTLERCFCCNSGWYDKRWMYEESFRMPLLIKWPGVTKAGTRTRALAQNIDFAPTFLEAAGVPIPENMQGTSLKPLLGGKTPRPWRKSLYYHYYERGEHHVPAHEGVRTERYKLIHFYDTDEWELFDLDKDPQEMKSVYADTGYAATVRRMQAELARLRTEYQVPSLQPQHG